MNAAYSPSDASSILPVVAIGGEVDELEGEEADPQRQEPRAGSAPAAGGGGARRRRSRHAAKNVTYLKAARIRTACTIPNRHHRDPGRYSREVSSSQTKIRTQSAPHPSAEVDISEVGEETQAEDRDHPGAGRSRQQVEEQDAGEQESDVEDDLVENHLMGPYRRLFLWG